MVDVGKVLRLPPPTSDVLKIAADVDIVTVSVVFDPHWPRPTNLERMGSGVGTISVVTYPGGGPDCS